MELSKTNGTLMWPLFRRDHFPLISLESRLSQRSSSSNVAVIRYEVRNCPVFTSIVFTRLIGYFTVKSAVENVFTNVDKLDVELKAN